MSFVESLKKAQIFSDLSEGELATVSGQCEQRTYGQGDKVLSEGETSRELFIIDQGMVQVSLGLVGKSSTPLINLGEGQVLGEMTLVDRGARSATVQVVSDSARLNVISHEDLLKLCEENNHFGYIFMRNLAAEISLKLRYYNIAEQMTNSQETKA
jgi:CRP-like cAMP-binding protein